MGLRTYLNKVKLGGKLDHCESRDQFTAFSAAGSEEDVEVVLAILPAFEFVEDPVRKRPETLGAAATTKAKGC